MHVISADTTVADMIRYDTPSIRFWYDTDPIIVRSLVYPYSSAMLTQLPVQNSLSRNYARVINRGIQEDTLFHFYLLRLIWDIFCVFHGPCIIWYRNISVMNFDMLLTSVQGKDWGCRQHLCWSYHQCCCPLLVIEHFLLLLHTPGTFCHFTSLQHHLYRLSRRGSFLSIFVVPLGFVLGLATCGLNALFVN